MDPQRLARFIEFLLIGVVMGLLEDVLAVHIATDATITLETLALLVLVAIPFAVLSELVVDHPAFSIFERLVEGTRATTR